MFSKELAELDRNTVQLMIDEMQDEINAQKKELDAQAEVIKDKDRELEDRDKVIEDKDKKLQEIIRAIYGETHDINKVAQLTGCSAEAVQSALK